MASTTHTSPVRTEALSTTKATKVLSSPTSPISLITKAARASAGSRNQTGIGLLFMARACRTQVGLKSSVPCGPPARPTCATEPYLSDVSAPPRPLLAALTTYTSACAFIKSGKARALALSASKRLPDQPNLPTFAELGYPELSSTT